MASTSLCAGDWVRDSDGTILRAYAVTACQALVRPTRQFQGSAPEPWRARWADVGVLRPVQVEWGALYTCASTMVSPELVAPALGQESAIRDVSETNVSSHGTGVRAVVCVRMRGGSWMVYRTPGVTAAEYLRRFTATGRGF